MTMASEMQLTSPLPHADDDRAITAGADGSAASPSQQRFQFLAKLSTIASDISGRRRSTTYGWRAGAGSGAAAAGAW